MRLLLVEDEQRLARALRRGLVEDGFIVEVANDGATGLELARHGDFDAIVLDVMLPRLSGFELVQTLRAEENWVPVLMLTARAGEHDQANGLDYGADDYLTKPFSYVVLLARLRALMRRTPQPRPPVLAAGDIRLDPSTRRVTVDGVAVALTPRELGLLEYLLRRPNRVVTKIEILDHVWDAAAGVNPNAVEVYVGYLRRKLGRPVVETVRGSGYRLTT
ncbi:MAG TPA: response regulator transcription factor [Actinomycetes bacterium]|nr:response regulator transcription factor [Actinomycetes bacterium]